ncbi:ubiquitin carboxyl-terminal hydrolase, family 1 [Colletotrichum karsti]|uniref:Ubiquitin carboxyl-terminal hydrolase n=1 Tax=Colletotrichum karsti TaxID=1095194 RepID=A0A9P6I024_9PEZI|nr:ubiquitin carboxyl-terminal hydrolase, family 1 [Colletotrichum karsti]KAF9873594.1 ubiquitin carboxyl-terminal hydrolase, family 1 [Colletotrichum karsti]
MSSSTRSAMAQRHVRSRPSQSGAVARQHTPQPVSDDNPVTTVERDIYAIESSQDAPASPATANVSIPRRGRGRPRKRKESPTAEMDEVNPDNSRRNPKRKATEAAAAATSAAAADEARDPYLLLREALRPISQEELQEWEGWCEVESEPAFFTAMLREMGVRNVKVQEVLSVDEDYVAMLPQPVYGFIFLYQYFAENYEDDQVVDGRDLWFANQTTDNACATVALTNILMNSDGVDLGKKLQDFKEATKDLSTPLRGHALSSNTFIRSVHNSFTRRMDHLNADLFLENEASESKKKKRRAPSKKKTKKQKINSESGFHFIAYVPANGSVWELDGLKTRPVCLGPLEDGAHWTNLVRPEIQARMLQFEESALSFNLLALCHTPLASISDSITSTIRSFELLSHRTRGLPGWEDLIAGNEQPLRGDEHERLAGFGCRPADIDHARIDPDFERKVKNPSLEMMELFELYSELVTQQKSQIGEYNAEIALMKEDEDRVQGRKKDHTPAIHCWVQKLADQGVLADWAANP